MPITWTPDGSDTPTALQNLAQVAALPTTQLKSCRQAAKDALELVNSALDVREMIQLFKGEPPRFRHNQVADNVDSLIHEWDSFENWPSGPLLRLCLLPKPNVARVVRDAEFRVALRSCIPPMAVHKDSLAKIERLKSNTSILVQKLKNGENHTSSVAMKRGMLSNKDVDPKRRQNNEGRHGHSLRDETGKTPSQNFPDSPEAFHSKAHVAGQSSPMFTSTSSRYLDIAGEETYDADPEVYSQTWENAISFNDFLSPLSKE